jgi:hypothetical protein
MRSARIAIVCAAVLGACAAPPLDLLRIAVQPDRCPQDPISGRVEPWGEPEAIDLGPEATLVLRDCLSEGEGQVLFRYDGPLGREGFHLVEYRLYEGGGWILVNAATGRQRALRAAGRPLLSPDGSLVALGGADLDGEYDPSGLWLLAFTDDSLMHVLELDGDGEWGAGGLGWITSDTLEYWEIRMSPSPVAGRWYDSTLHRAVRSEGVWITTKLP